MCRCLVERRGPLASVVEPGELDRMLFGKAWSELAGNKGMNIMKETLDSLLQMQVTEQILADKLNDVTAKIKDIGENINDIYPDQNVVEVTFFFFVAASTGGRAFDGIIIIETHQARANYFKNNKANDPASTWLPPSNTISPCWAHERTARVAPTKP